jgi:hypothetical protein
MVCEIQVIFVVIENGRRFLSSVERLQGLGGVAET